MSKKIWRGHTSIGRITGETSIRSDRDCTVISDAACFPVKEAMAKAQCDDALVVISQQMSNALYNLLQRGSVFNYSSLSNLVKEWDAVDKTPRVKYLRAVERLKKKAGRK